SVRSELAAVTFIEYFLLQQELFPEPVIGRLFGKLPYGAEFEGRTPESGVRPSNSGFVDHPRGEALQEIFEALHVLHGKAVFHIRVFECLFETAQPNLARL